MAKINDAYIIQQYQVATSSYRRLTLDLGLWQSEQQLFEQYFARPDKLLDIGCGTGRTTFGLFQLGYSSLIGLDLTPAMIQTAKELNPLFNSHIEFVVGNACELPFPDSSFEGAIFSFNGWMSIPQREARLQAAQEIYRVLQPKSYWIFTTHDRESDTKYHAFWKQEKLHWNQGKQSEAVFEYGDLITASKNESGKIFIHIPNQKEVESLLQESRFEIVESFMRDKRFKESPEVLAASGNCRFWVARKGKVLPID